MYFFNDRVYELQRRFEGSLELMRHHASVRLNAILLALFKCRLTRPPDHNDLLRDIY